MHLKLEYSLSPSKQLLLLYLSILYFFSDAREEMFCLKHPGIVGAAKVKEMIT